MPELGDEHREVSASELTVRCAATVSLNAMARRVLLHIGTMKSATTYLQGLCSANAQRLAEQGLLWPSEELPFLAAADLVGRDTERPGHQGAWAELVQSFRQHHGDAVWSNELIAPLGPGKIKRLVRGMEPAEVEVVLTARDLGRVIPSHWQTTLKNGSTTTWSDFAAAVCAEPAHDGNVPRSKDIGSWFWRRHDLAAILSRWQQFVPAERMTVVTVPPPGNGPEIVGGRFASVIGVDGSRFEQPAYDNSSVGASSAELLRRLNVVAPALQRHHYRWGIKDALARLALIGRAEQEPPFGLTQPQQDWVCARADRMIEQIRASPVRIVGDLTDLRPAREARTDTFEPADTSDADLLETALVGLGEMAKIVADLRVEQKRKRYDVDSETAALP